MLARPLRLLLLVAAESAALLVLLRLGTVPALALPHGDLGTWLRDTPPTDALAAALRLVALAGAAWLLATTLLYALSCVVTRSHRRSAVRSGLGRVAAGITLPAVRRLVDGALACALVTTAAFGTRPALAATTPATTVSTTTTTTTPAPVVLERPGPTVPPTVRDGRADIASLPGPTPTTRPVAVAPAPATPAPVTPVTPVTPAPTTPPPASPITHVVAPGEHLWAIAAERVAAASGRTARELRADEIAPYWRAVCDANRAGVRSGNVNLIYPGEVVVLPALP